MAQRGQSAHEAQEELEAYRDRLAREKSRQEMIRRLRWPLLCLVLGVIIAFLIFVLMSDRPKEWVDHLRNIDIVDSVKGPSEFFQPTPEESCQSTSENIVKIIGEDDRWPMQITQIEVIETDPVTCKGVAYFLDGTVDTIKFSDRSGRIGFEPFPSVTCADLGQRVIRYSENEPRPLVRVTGPRPIATEPGDRLSCRGVAEYADGGEEIISMHEDAEVAVNIQRLRSETCQDLGDQLALIGKTKPTWPVKLENLSPISQESGDGLSCKATVTYRDGDIAAMEIYEDASMSIGFRALALSERECDKTLTHAIIEMAKDNASRDVSKRQILKIYDPEEISRTTHKLTCGGQAMFDTSGKEMIEFYVEEDKDGDRFIGFDAE